MIYIKGKLLVCLMMCLILCIPVLYGTFQCWSYRIDGISASAMTYNGTNVIVGSSSGGYYLFNEYGEVVGQDDLDSGITSVDISENNMILGTKSATLILSFTGKKLSHFTSEPVLSVTISESDSCAISGTEKNVFIFPSLRSATELYVGAPVNYVSVSPDGEKAAAATSGRIHLFTIDGIVTSEDHEIPSTTSMQFLRDGSLVAGTKNGSLYLIGETADRIGDNLGSITTIETGDDVIVAGTSSGTIYLYDSSGTEITRFTVDNLVDCDISSNGFIVAANSQRLYMFNENGEILWQKDIEDIKSVEISSDGRKMAVTTDNGILFFCNWTDTFHGTRLFPYPSREQYSFEDFKRIWTYSVPHVLTPYIKQRTMRVAVGDVNGNGVNEIAVSAGKKLAILDPEGKVIAEKDVTEEVLHIALIDIDKDTVPEIFYTVNDGRYTIFVMDFKNGEFEDLKDFDFTSYFGVSSKEKMEAAIAPVVSYDIDEDENPEILAVVNSGYTLKPRGILAFEYSSGDVEWFYKSAASLSIDAFYDIDEDGKPEIIVGSHSCCNGSVEGDRNDCDVYLIVLNLNGEEVWSMEIASGLQVVRVGVEDINKDGKIEIVGTVLHANNVYGRIFVMDSKGEILYDKDGFDYSLWLGGIVDFDGNGFKEIVVTDSDGNVSIYNHTLDLLKTESIATYQLSEVEGINDMDGDGDKEIVVRVWDKSVRILSSDLEEEWSSSFENPPMPEGLVANVSGCGNDLLILKEKALEMYSFEGEGKYLCATPPEPTSPPTETPEPTSPTEKPEPSPPDNYRWPLVILTMILAIISLIILKKFIRRREVLDLMILSLEKRNETKYQVALESVHGTIYPVRSARTIDISPEVRSEVIGRIEYTSKVITNYLNPERKEPLKKPTEELKRMGTVIYRNFIPRDFAQELVHHYMVLEAEDVQIPWELMYSDQFFALKYAISRR
ncbi:MAG: PQQ-binding-like beta-propeller repeat protein, partial [Theionarchaea archaeon]|nr:PQQ-binding-like beta-propeller repeat protein [Theionarchaea archaeon]